MAKGPMAAVQLMLRALGWDPVRPAEWVDPEGCRWMADGTSDHSELTVQLQHDVRRQLVRQANQHAEGAGIEGGLASPRCKGPSGPSGRRGVLARRGLYSAWHAQAIGVRLSAMRPVWWSALCA